MIIVKLLGGLGNQMFQYAAGKALAERTGNKLVLDLTHFDNYQLRKYELNYFHITDRIASRDDILEVAGESFFIYVINKISKKTANRTLIKNKKIIKEKDFGFNREAYNAEGSIYLDGYWQSERYFKDIEEKIKRLYCVDSITSDSFEYFSSLINNSKEPVSIHVRRGDYISNPTANAYHGVCSIKYYRNASNFIENKINYPTYFIFSDDINWCKSNLGFIRNCVYVELESNSPDFEEIYLMSMCSHNIIANSSFSWWGAWLNNTSNKIVISPKNWFSDKSIDTSDLIPDLWVRL